MLLKQILCKGFATCNDILEPIIQRFLQKVASYTKTISYLSSLLVGENETTTELKPKKKELRKQNREIIHFRDEAT